MSDNASFGGSELAGLDVACPSKKYKLCISPLMLGFSYEALQAKHSEGYSSIETVCLNFTFFTIGLNLLIGTSSLQVLYNLFEWPSRKGSRLAVIAVANTMDLPERLLPRIASRLGGRRLVFQPYTRPQLIAIVSTRLKDAGLQQCFAENAINMACSKANSFWLQAKHIACRTYYIWSASSQASSE